MQRILLIKNRLETPTMKKIFIIVLLAVLTGCWREKILDETQIVEDALMYSDVKEKQILEPDWQMIWENNELTGLETSDKHILNTLTSMYKEADSIYLVELGNQEIFFDKTNYFSRTYGNVIIKKVFKGQNKINSKITVILDTQAIKNINIMKSIQIKQYENMPNSVLDERHINTLYGFDLFGKDYSDDDYINYSSFPFEKFDISKEVIMFVSSKNYKGDSVNGNALSVLDYMFFLNENDKYCNEDQTVSFTLKEIVNLSKQFD